MNNQIIPLSFENHSIRMCGTPERPLFVAKDVCAALEIKNHRAAVESLDPDEIAHAGFTDDSSSSRKTMTLLCVTESGLYGLAFRSRKPEAKRFRRWITEEVLPSLRLTGTYSTHPGPPADATPLVAEVRELISLVKDLVIHITGAKPAKRDSVPIMNTFSPTRKPVGKKLISTQADNFFLSKLAPNTEYSFTELAQICKDHCMYSLLIKGGEFLGKWRLSDRSNARFGLHLQKLIASTPRFKSSNKGRHRRFFITRP